MKSSLSYQAQTTYMNRPWSLIPPLMALALVNYVRAQAPGTVDFAGGYVCPSDPWQLVFYDDFEGSSLDVSKWVNYFPYTDDGSDSCEYCRLADESSDAVIEDDNVVVSGGICHLLALPEQGNWLGQSRPYTTGMLYSRLAFNEGKFEVRCKIPQGFRLWPAFWAYGGETEIDVFEGCGSEPGTLDLTLHRWWNNNQGHELGHAEIDLGSSIHDSFHTYSVEWDRMFVRFYVDGNEVWWRSRYFDQFSGELLSSCVWAPNTYGHLPYFPKSNDFVHAIAGLGILAPYHSGVCGGVPINNIGDDLFPAAVPAELQIDFIRVYQRQPQAGLTNLCQDPAPSISGSDAFCSVGQELVFTLSGIHGSLVTWDVPNGLTILESTNDFCRIRCDMVQPGGLFTISAIDNLNPCSHGQISMTKIVKAGPPRIETAPGNLAQDCDDFFCIDYPHVWGAGTGPWDYDILVDGVLQEETYLPFNPNEIPGGQYVYGMDCLNYLVVCNIYAPWPFYGDPFCYYSPGGDYCHEVTFVAENGCGAVSETLVVRDQCVVGPCDIIDPDPGLVDALAPYVHVSPVPADNEFTITIDPQIDLEILSKVDVRDAMMITKASVVKPTSRSFTVNSSSWSTGVYYVMVAVNDHYVLTKVQIK